MKTWDVAKTLFKVSDFVTWQRNNTLDLTPNFQRRPVWKPGAKSYFIDTIVRGLPIPIIFLRERAVSVKTLRAEREVVDGQQRLRTLFSYIDPTLLPDYDPASDDFVVKRIHNPALANRPFRDISDEDKRRILEYQFSVHILPSGTEDRDVLQIFARMNATGVKLNDQELRNAEFFGEFKTSMYELALAQYARWQKWGVFSRYDIARMQEVELTSEFAQLIVEGIVGKSQRSLNDLYQDNDDKFAERAEVERRFRYAMDAIEQNFGSDIKALGLNRRTLFFALFASLYDLSFEIGSDLQLKRPSKVPATAAAWIRKAAANVQAGSAPKTVLEALARRTTHPSSRKTVIEYLRRVD